MPRMPDIDVLEAALAAANEDDKEVKPEAKTGGDKSPDGNDRTLDGVPALTLDAALEEKRNKAVPISKETADGLGKAESLRDLTASMAETLFGNAEFEAIAAEVVAKPPPGKEPAAKPKADNAPTAKPAPGKDAAAAPEKDPSLLLELVEDTKAGEANEPPAHDKEVQMSTTRRLDLIKQLNSGNADENIEMGETNGPKAVPKKSNDSLQTLEDQLQSAMTATVKALEDPESPPAEADEEPKKKTGLFSRFTRSS